MKKTLDDPKTTVERVEIINRKFILKQIYIDFYLKIKNKLNKKLKGKVIELGSGAGFIKQIISKTITTDIMDLPNVDIPKLNAEKLPFKNTSLSAILMVNVLHHINDPEKALKEFSRTLKKGGVVVMIEPANTLLGRFINQNFHHEEFNPQAGWKLTDKGPLSGGNGAIPWIIFERDKKVFNAKFKNLKIDSIEYHTPFKYVLSGGFSKPQLIPNFLYKPLNLVEKIVSPLNKYLGMFTTIVIKKI